MTENTLSLTSERLVLREQLLGDWLDYRDFMTSENSRLMGGPFSEMQAWTVFYRDASQWNQFGHGALMIDLKGTDECIGQIVINHDPLFPEKTLGWMLYPQFQGNGYSVEAARTVRDWAFETLNLESMTSHIDRENTRSLAVARKLGAELDPKALRRRPDDLVFRHINPAFKAAVAQT